MENIAQLPERDQETQQQQLLDNEDIRDAMQAAALAVGKLRDDRKAINAEIQSELENLKALGIPKEAFKRALKDITLDEDVLQATDHYYAVARRVLGRPVQIGLFAEGNPLEVVDEAS